MSCGGAEQQIPPCSLRSLVGMTRAFQWLNREGYERPSLVKPADELY
jgi:hypothetical protein